jgi:LemA protein
MKIALVVLGVVLLAVLLFGGKLVGVRNDLVQQSEAINGAWAQVDVDLQRRADLIPNLVETVKGYAKHEQEVLNNIAAARSALLNARNPQERIQANTQLDSALGRLLVVVENYPQLKADEGFRNLQFELAGAENRIAQSRRRYNEAVQRYNTTINLFPNNIAASIFGFSRNDAYFKTDPAAREVPKVKF